jgi:hypothetical protein
MQARLLPRILKHRKSWYARTGCKKKHDHSGLTKTFRASFDLAVSRSNPFGTTSDREIFEVMVLSIGNFPDFTSEIICGHGC